MNYQEESDDLHFGLLQSASEGFVLRQLRLQLVLVPPDVVLGCADHSLLFVQRPYLKPKHTFKAFGHQPPPRTYT